MNVEWEYRRHEQNVYIDQVEREYQQHNVEIVGINQECTVSYHRITM